MHVTFRSRMRPLSPVGYRHRVALSQLILLTCGLVGCSSEFSTVKGTVTLDGVPLENAFVEFTPQTPGGSMAYGRTDASGKYDLMFSLKQHGALPGENVVRITTADIGDMGAANIKERVPLRYNKNTELRVDVLPNQRNTHNFDLKTEGAKVVQPKYTSDG